MAHKKYEEQIREEKKAEVDERIVLFRRMGVIK